MSDDVILPGEDGPPDGSDAALALDFALGTLDGGDLRAAELRLRRDPAFAADVAAWQRDLAPLADGIAPVAAPASVWSAVEAELFRTTPPARAAAPSRWSSLAVWRSLAFGTSAVAAVALGVLVARPGIDAPVPERARDAAVVVPRAGLLAASMASTDAAKAVMITAIYDADRGAVVLTPAADTKRRGLTPQLWVIVGTDAPRSLGVIDLAGASAHPIPDAMRAQLKRGATLAISLEPAGGSPTGAPTGPVVATGVLATL